MEKGIGRKKFKKKKEKEKNRAGEIISKLEGKT